MYLIKPIFFWWTYLIVFVIGLKIDIQFQKKVNQRILRYINDRLMIELCHKSLPLSVHVLRIFLKTLLKIYNFD